VAKEATLVAVRVLDCSGSGTYSGVIAGIDWVTADHQAGQPAVANMSLGGPASASVDDAVANSVADGVVYAVAAGNSNANACNSSPARAPSALTVAATDNTDTRASFSNYGSCVDLFAPGVSITSDWSSSDTATNTISGTSMATPHVAGVAALTLAGSPGATVDQVNQAMLSNATPGIVTNAGSGTPNRLLYVGSEPVPPPPPPLVANDMFADATVLTGTSGNTSGTNVDATKEPGEPNHAGNAGGASIWYRLTPTTSGTATIDTVGSDFDTLLAVYTGSAVGALTEVASNDDISLFFNVQSRVQFPVTAGVTYNIAVDGWSGASGPATGAVTLNWTIAPSSPPPAAPSLSIADASINEGRRGTRSMTFTVSLSAPTSTTVTVAYATADGTATAGSDYQAKSGTVSIAAGGTSATVKVVVYGDRNPEPNETFTVNLSNPTGGATIGDGTATGTIINDD
jgi:subtilisin family serine protease